jgi:hypothetical protein
MDNEVVKVLSNASLPQHVIAGVLGNIDVETGGTFDYTQKQKGGNGYGLFQFDFHKPHYDKWLENTGKKDSEAAQTEYFLDTIYGESQDIIGKKMAREIQSKLAETQTAAEAAQVLSEMWLRPGKPHLERRMRSASVFDTVMSDMAKESSDEVVSVMPDRELMGSSVGDPISALGSLKNFL